MTFLSFKIVIAKQGAVDTFGRALYLVLQIRKEIVTSCY